jgi:hypothetical protein
MLNAKVALIILLGLFVGAWSLAYSYPPIPGPAKASDKPQTETENNHQATEHGQNLSEIRLIWSNGLINTIKIQPSTKQNQTEKDNKAPSGWWIIGITGVIAGAAVLQFFTTRKQVEAMQETIKLTRENYIASHPPKLRVHSVSLNAPLEYQGIVINEKWHISFYVDNIGGSIATITESYMGFEYFESLSGPLPFSNNPHMLPEKPVKPGGAIEVIHNLDEFNQESEYHPLASYDLISKPEGYYFFGYINYVDGIGTMRRAGFCRRYNREHNGFGEFSESFTKVDNEDYEYSY